MRLTDSAIIKQGERELFDNILAELDWEVVDAVIKEKHGLEVEEDVSFRAGDLVVADGQVAYKLEFEVKLNLSILIDREGNYLSLKASTSKHTDTQESPDSEAEPRQQEDIGSEKGEGS